MILLRFLEKYNISSAHLPRVLVRMRMGGASNNSISNRIDGLRAILNAFDKNQIKVNKLNYLVYRYLPKITQLLKKAK